MQWIQQAATLALAVVATTLTIIPALAATDSKSVVVVSIVEHPALDAVRDGVQQSLKESGFTAGQNLKWQFQSAQGNMGTAAQIARKFVGDAPDVIVAIGTPAAQAVAAATREIPIVYSAVTDPVAAQLVPSWDKWDGNITGVSDRVRLNTQIELIKQVVPEVKRVGIVYNPGEANSVASVRELKAALDKEGIILVESAAPRTVDVYSAARKLVGKVDVIYTNTDNNVASAYESMTKLANESKIPLIASDTGTVSRGAVAAMGISYHELGLQAGREVVRILQGEKAGNIPSQESEKLQLVVNLKAAAQQGVTLPEDLIKNASEVIK